MMDRKILEARVRQLLAADQNALAIYTELAELTTDKELRASFLGVIKDEKRHAILDQEILTLLEA
ncbi:MAG: hypothetical protein HQL21_00215 [Candidatus Omnitrophica bacterium]|nr:hypothetical protein [Candidatus Omnitrophota bacterium]